MIQELIFLNRELISEWNFQYNRASIWDMLNFAKISIILKFSELI